MLQEYSTPPGSPVTQRNSETNPSVCLEYRQLSPKNLLSTKCPVNKPQRSSGKIEIGEASQPVQSSTSSVNQSNNSPVHSRKKKTLEELAKEWNANQVYSLFCTLFYFVFPLQCHFYKWGDLDNTRI